MLFPPPVFLSVSPPASLSANLTSSVPSTPSGRGSGTAVRQPVPGRGRRGRSRWSGVGCGRKSSMCRIRPTSSAKVSASTRPTRSRHQVGESAHQRSVALPYQRHQPVNRSASAPVSSSPGSQERGAGRVSVVSAVVVVPVVSTGGGLMPSPLSGTTRACPARAVHPATPVRTAAAWTKAVRTVAARTAVRTSRPVARGVPCLRENRRRDGSSGAWLRRWMDSARRAPGVRPVRPRAADRRARGGAGPSCGYGLGPGWAAPTGDRADAAGWRRHARTGDGRTSGSRGARAAARHASGPG